MKRYIQDGKETVLELEQEMNENQPPLFFEYTTGTPVEKHDIKGQLQELKAGCEKETEAAWYEWKKQLLEPLFSSFSENLARLERDYGYLEGFKEQAEIMANVAMMYSVQIKESIVEKERL